MKVKIPIILLKLNLTHQKKLTKKKLKNFPLKKIV